MRIVPAASVIMSVVDFLISFLILLVLMGWFKFVPSWKIVFLPGLLILASVTAFGTGTLIGALNVRYRDFRHIVPFVAQFGLYISPVGFSSSVVPEKWRILYFLNPMAGVIDGFRWAILGGKEQFYVLGAVESVCTSFALLLIGLWYFRRTERVFADYI
jgi:lipopolysaccharide transport system permease protein